MSIQVQHRRGNTIQTNAFTGAVGEVTVDTDKEVVVVHDGITPGGFPSITQNFANTIFARANIGSKLAYVNVSANGTTLTPSSNVDVLTFASSNDIVLIANSTNSSIQITLGATNVTPNTYGGVNTMPVLVVDKAGRITSASNVAITAGAAVGNSAPGSPLGGSLWWNSQYGRLFVYYTDVDSSQWVDASPTFNTGPINDIANAAFASANNVGIEANAVFVVANAAFTQSNGQIGRFDSTIYSSPTGDLMGTDTYLGQTLSLDAFGVKLIDSYDNMEPMGSMVYTDLGQAGAI